MLPCSSPVLGVDLAGLFGDGERPKLERSAVGVLLFNLSFGGVLFGGLAQASSLGLSLFLGLPSAPTRTPGDVWDEGDGDDTFTGLKLSLSFSFEGVFFLGLDLDDDCTPWAVGWPSSGLLAVAVLPPGAEEVVEFDREGGGVGAAHLSGLGLCCVRHGDRSLRGADLVAATVFGLACCSSSLFFLGVAFKEATRRTWRVWGGRRLASSWAFKLEPARLRLTAGGLLLIASLPPARTAWALSLTAPGTPSSSGCMVLVVVGALLGLGCGSPRSERPS